MIKNSELINIRKREMVEEICHFVEKYPQVQKVVIFGSTVREDCTENSDLDICLYTGSKDIIGQDFFRIYGYIDQIAEYNSDILIYDKLDEKFREKVEKTGIVVLQR